MQRGLTMRWTFASPGGDVALTVGLDGAGRLSCDAARRGADQVTVLLGIERADASFDAGLAALGAPVVGAVDEAYEMRHGKRSRLHHHATTATVAVCNAAGDRLDLDLRVYDTAIAFRYRFPENDDDGRLRTVTGEMTTFRLPADGRAWLQPVSPSDSPDHAHENLYANGVPIGTPSPSHAWDLPATFEVEGHWLLVGEADLDAGYHGARLAGAPHGRSYAVVGPDSWEGRGLGAAQASSTLPWTLPWRFIGFADTAAALLESTVVTDLARPSRLADTSWIRPGRASWSWWSDVSSPRDLATLRRFVDLAAEMGWEYSLIDANWTVHSEAEMRQLVRYAAARAVGIWLWYNSGGPHNDVAGEPRDLMHEQVVRRREMARIAAWGVVGLKVDFFHSDKQDGIGRYLGILEDAAEARLMVNFHGCTVPRGWERTWPHLMTMEAVRGAEWYLINLAFADDAVWHNTVLPFTRNVIGPMDYTPVTFSDTFRARRTTAAHELALAVVFETGILHFADSAESYRNQDPAVLDVLRRVPVAWDDTVGLAGEPGDHAVMARRNGDTWWVAGINGPNANPGADLDLTRLGPLRGTWCIVHDGAGRDSVLTREVRIDDQPEFAGFRSPPMAAGGGFVARLEAH